MTNEHRKSRQNFDWCKHSTIKYGKTLFFSFSQSIYCNIFFLYSPVLSVQFNLPQVNYLCTCSQNVIELNATIVHAFYGIIYYFELYEKRRRKKKKTCTYTNHCIIWDHNCALNANICQETTSNDNCPTIKWNNHL